MNNLKRVLSLGLAGTMLSSMMVAGASAKDFTDSDKIEKTEAVNTLVALSIINGKDDGSFDPNGDVTRGEMAKMIAVAMNGGNEANTGVKVNPTYTDIKGHWAESYIEYCADMKIISGRGDGTFDPNGNVTGLEATKMVLTALGYDATAYKLVGNTWAVRTDELARTADPKLYENLESVMMASNATREVAAQLIWNGLQNKTVSVQPSTNTSSGEVTWNYKTSDDTLLKQRYDADIWVGNYSGNDKFGSTTAAEGEIVVTGDLEGLKGSYDAKVPSDLSIAYVGEEVKVVFKDNTKTGTKGQPDKHDKIFGVFVTGNSGTVTSYQGAVKNNKSDKTQINVDGTKYDLATSVDVWNNYTTKTTYSGAQLYGNDTTNSKLTGDLKKPNGNVLKLVMNNDNEVETIYVTESKIAKVTAVNSTKVTLSGIGSIEFEDNAIYDGIAKDDIVVVTTLYKAAATTDGAYSIVEKPEVVSGTVKSFKEKETITFTDGETYSIVGETDMDDNVASDARKAMKDEYIGEDFDLYLVNGYVAAAVQTSEGNSNYSVIIDTDTTGTLGSVLNGWTVRVMDADGTKTALTVSEDSYLADGTLMSKNSTQAKVELVKGTIVTWSLNKDGEADIEVEAAAAKPGSNVKYVKSTKSIAGDKTTTDCVLFYTNGDGAYKVANIRDLGDFTIAITMDHAVVTNSDGDVVAVFADLVGKPSGATSTTVYGIVSKYVGKVEIDDTKYYQYIVDVNDDQYTVNIKTKAVAKGDVVKLDPTSDDIYTASEFAKVSGYTAAGYVVDYDTSDETLTIASAVKYNVTKKIYEADGTITVYAVDDETKYFFVDKDNECGVDGVVSEFDAAKATKNIIVYVDSDGVTVTDVIFEVSNEADII